MFLFSVLLKIAQLLVLNIIFNHLQVQEVLSTSPDYWTSGLLSLSLTTSSLFDRLETNPPQIYYKKPHC